MPKPVFVAGGHNGLRTLSADGKTWATPVLGKEGEIYRCAAGGNGRAVLVGSFGGSNIFAVTTDGTTWKTATKDAGYVKYIRGLSFGNGTFLGLGGDPGSVGLANPFAMLSTDGEKWDAPEKIPSKFMLRRAAFGNKTWAAVGDRGHMGSSPDGKTWKVTNQPKAIDTLIDIAFGNGVFVGVGLHGLRMRTADGQKWSDKQTGEEGEHLNSVVWAKDRFVAVGAGATYFSRDGLKWEKSANTDAPTTVAYGNGIFVGTRWKGKILRSTDGVKWEQVFSSEHHLEAVSFGEVG